MGGSPAFSDGSTAATTPGFEISAERPAHNATSSTLPTGLNDSHPLGNPRSLGNPNALKLNKVFPVPIAEAIRRNRQSHDGESGGTWAAALEMTFFDSFAFNDKLGAMMSLEVASHKVQHLADKLFGVSVESTDGNGSDGNRYLLLPSQVRVVPTPDLVLRGCKREVLSEVFGLEITKAIQKSLAYEEEAMQGHPLTECVSMTITHRASDGAVINLSLHERYALDIMAEMY